MYITAVCVHEDVADTWMMHDVKIQPCVIYSVKLNKDKAIAFEKYSVAA